MGKKERQAMRLLGIKEGKSDKPGATFQLPPFLKMDWYLSSLFEKLLFVLGFIALIYSILTTLIFGFPWN